MALTEQQQTQLNQLVAAGAPQDVAMTAVQQIPAAQGPVTPTPQIKTPAAPAPQAVSQTTQSPQQTGANAFQGAATGTLTMPATGSVVDLLNMAGVDSSQANRKALAQQYGIQNYDFSAAKNQELAQKFLEAYNANKQKPVPESGAQAASALDQYFSAVPEAASVSPQQKFMDAFSSMNPIEANLFQQLSGLLATPQNKQSLVDIYKQEIEAQGIPGLNMELADINRIIDGTEDDIRAEISNVGGFATESQVQALVGARNKTLLRRAQYLSDVISSRNDYVDRIVSLTGEDRKAVSDELDRKLGITKTLLDVSQSMTNAARENYQAVVDKVGYAGLIEGLGGNKNAQTRAEMALGLPSGSLSPGSALSKYGETSEPKIYGSADSGYFTYENGKLVPVPTVGGRTVGGQQITDVTGVSEYGTPEYVVGRLLATASSKTKPVASEREQLGKFANVVALTGNLVDSLDKTQNGPIIGYLKSLNPYDFDARAVNAQVTALVPSVARGLYGEVGVLTDQDIERYLGTLPNIKSTDDQNKFIAMMTLANARRSYEQTLLNLANSNVNVSGFVDSYQNLISQLDFLEADLGVSEPEFTSEDEAVFDTVVGTASEENYWLNLWNALQGK